MGLTLLSQAALPLAYWDYAFQTSVYLINRLPTSALNFEVPYTKQFHQPPDYTFPKPLDVHVFPIYDPTITISYNSGLRNVCF